MIYNEDERRRVAYHEAGHTLIAWLEPEGDRPEKVSIIPRGRAGGVTITPPNNEDRVDYGLDYFQARLACLMGGRAADKMMYGQAYSGHEGDLKQATKLARFMVTHWGMSERLGPIAFRIGEEHVFLGKEIQEQRDFSDGTAQIIDEEVQRILLDAEARALKMLEENKDQLDAIVEALVLREELFRDEIERVINGEDLPPPDPSTLPPVTTDAVSNGESMTTRREES